MRLEVARPDSKLSLKPLVVGCTLHTFLHRGCLVKEAQQFTKMDGKCEDITEGKV